MDPISLEEINFLEDLNKHFGWLRATANQHKWRLTQPQHRVRGGVKGLPIYGTLLATDGMEAVLLMPCHTSLFTRHLDNFIPDIEISISTLRSSGKKQQEDAIGSKIVDALVNKYCNI